MEIEDIYVDIAKNIKARFNTSNYESDRLLSREKNKRVIGLIKDELSRKIIKMFVTLS